MNCGAHTRWKIQCLAIERYGQRETLVLEGVATAVAGSLLRCYQDGRVLRRLCIRVYLRCSERQLTGSDVYVLLFVDSRQ
ncbi:hypothetical protein D3C84_968690 [compost metagenome]